MPQVESNIEAALSVIPATSPILLDRCANINFSRFAVLCIFFNNACNKTLHLTLEYPNHC